MPLLPEYSRLVRLQRFLNVISGKNLLYGLLDVQAVGIMAGIGFVRHRMDLAVDNKLVIVQIAAVRGNAEVMPHVLAAQALLAGHQGLIQLFAVAGTDDAGAGIAKQLLHGFGQISDGGGVRLLDEQVARIGMFKCELDKVDGLIEVHQEAGHVGVGDGDGIARANLVNEQRNNRSTAAHNVAVPGAADDRIAALRRHTGVGIDDVLHHGFGNAHCVDRISCLVGGQADDPLDTCLDGGVEHVVGANNIGSNRFHREELTGRHLLEGRGMEYVVNPRHSVPQRLRVADIADVEFDLVGVVRVFSLELVTHIILLLFVAGEDADLANVGGQKVFKDGIAERTGTAGDHKGGV